MSISSAAKIGTAGTLAATIPTTAYFAKDHIFLYQIERDVLKDDVKLTVEDSTDTASQEGIVALVKVNEKTTWSCLIKVKLSSASDSGQEWNDSTDKSKLKNYISKRIPLVNAVSETPPAEITDTIKQENKKMLVWECSNNRTLITNESIKTELTIEVKKTSDSKLMTSLFGVEEEVKSS